MAEYIDMYRLRSRLHTTTTVDLSDAWTAKITVNISTGESIFLINYTIVYLVGVPCRMSYGRVRVFTPQED